jgi:hypothetical protein
VPWRDDDGFTLVLSIETGAGRRRDVLDPAVYIAPPEKKVVDA